MISELPSLEEFHADCTPQRCLLAASWERDMARLHGFIERQVECRFAAARGLVTDQADKGDHHDLR